jgi:hypothetical protein
MLGLEKAAPISQMGLTGGAQPIFPKQRKNMLKLLHLRMEFLHFFRLQMIFLNGI